MNAKRGISERDTPFLREFEVKGRKAKKKKKKLKKGIDKAGVGVI